MANNIEEYFELFYLCIYIYILSLPVWYTENEGEKWKTKYFLLFKNKKENFTLSIIFSLLSTVEKLVACNSC